MPLRATFFLPWQARHYHGQPEAIPHRSLSVWSLFFIPFSYTTKKKKVSKPFLMFPSQWTELEALFLPMMGAKKLLRPRLSVPPAARTESCLPETHLHWPWSPCPQNLIEREQEDSITHCSAYNKQGPTLATEPTSLYIRVCVLTSTYADIMYT